MGRASRTKWEDRVAIWRRMAQSRREGERLMAEWMRERFLRHVRWFKAGGR